MANRRITVQLDFNGPNPLIINSNGTFDKRTSLVNLSRLIRGLDAGKKAATLNEPASITVQQSDVQATGTVTPASVINADHVDAAGTALTATQLRAKGTVTAASVAEGDVATINGQAFTAVNGAVTLGDPTFDCSGSNTACATSLAAQINAYGGGLVNGVVKAKSSGAVVTVYGAAIGAEGNAYTLSSSDGAHLAVSGANLTGGAAAANNQFDFIGTNAETATDIVRAIGASTSAAWKALKAVAASNVVTVTSRAPGVSGNAVTWTSNNARLAVSGSGTLTGGSAGAPTQWNL